MFASFVIDPDQKIRPKNGGTRDAKDSEREGGVLCHRIDAIEPREHEWEREYEPNREVDADNIDNKRNHAIQFMNAL